ncbi:hypothetical protein ABZ599_15530 [Streptomyces misionensis]|uniref:hypothetical protein n=1 Tax=Streptomyces misionensis TaxID=67331 RepID=UPI0033D639BF
MSDELTPALTWEEIADSWRLDELIEIRLQPSTSDDVLTLMTIGALRSRRPLDKARRREAFDAMMAAADGGAETGPEQTLRDPARIEQTRQAMLRALEEDQQQREE